VRRFELNDFSLSTIQPFFPDTPQGAPRLARAGDRLDGFSARPRHRQRL
jgi:hypothetical protein